MRGQLAQVVHVQPVFSVFLVVERADQAMPQLRVVLRQEERPDVVVVTAVCLVGAPVLRDEMRRHPDLAAVVGLPFALRVRKFVHPRLERPALLVGQDGTVPLVERYPRALDVLRVDQPAALGLRVPPVGAPGPLGGLAAKGIRARVASLGGPLDARGELSSSEGLADRSRSLGLADHRLPRDEPAERRDALRRGRRQGVPCRLVEEALRASRGVRGLVGRRGGSDRRLRLLRLWLRRTYLVSCHAGSPFIPWTPWRRW